MIHFESKSDIAIYGKPAGGHKMFINNVEPKVSIGITIEVVIVTVEVVMNITLVTPNSHITMNIGTKPTTIHIPPSGNSLPVYLRDMGKLVKGIIDQKS